MLPSGDQSVAAIANDESLQVRVRKSHPPGGRSSRHPSTHKGVKTGCALTLRSAASLQKHRSVACKARVKQVKPWTYPRMVLVPLCTKMVMAWPPQRELRVVKSVGSTPVQCVDHLVPLCSGTFSFSVLGVGAE